METMECREIQKGDESALLKLIIQLAIFEKEPNAVEITEEDLTRCLFDTKICFGWVALSGSNIIGMAICYTRFSTWKGECTYLEDLIVSESFRGKGVGKFLLNKVIDHAANNNRVYAMWQVLDWNTDAIEFYKKMGVEFESNWLNVKRCV